jgi:ABC-type transport system involved in multi-copper enzyme maturation permease subunit
MAIETLGYRGWSGTLHSPWMACPAIVRTGLRLLLRRKVFWLLFALGLLHFLLHFSLIYIKAQLTVRDRRFAQFLDGYQVTGTGDAFLEFMFAQGTVTMLLLAFAGSMLVGSDYQQGGLMFYLSRRVDRRHYVLGKLLAIAAIVLLITAAPALVLFLEYGLLSGSLDYFRDNPRIVLGIIGYGLLMAAVLSLLLASIASWVHRAVPLVMIWAGIFVLLPVLGENLRRGRDNRLWRLLGLWGDLRVLAKSFFGSLSVDREEPDLAYWSAWLVSAVCLLCLILLIRRVRAVEVVK